MSCSCSHTAISIKSLTALSAVCEFDRVMIIKSIIIITFVIINVSVFALVLNDNPQYGPTQTLTRLNDAESDKAHSHSSNNAVINHCSIKTCVPICCPHGQKLSRGKCIPIIHNGINNWRQTYFPQIYDLENFESINVSRFNFDDLTSNSKYFNAYINIFIHDPCSRGIKYRLEPDLYPEDEYKLLSDGSIIKKNKESISVNDYCLSIVNGKTYSVVLCADTITRSKNGQIKYDLHLNRFETALDAGFFISLPFLFVTFIVYSIIPELRNLHGFTLRNYITFLFISYALFGVVRTCVAHGIQFSDEFCTTIAFIIYFSFFSSFFWLNVMSFDIWWTFRKCHGLDRTMKQERKKYFTYSLYAWSGASFFTGICLIMDFVPQIPDNFIRPQFGVHTCGYITDAAAAIYVYPPMGLLIVFNIYFFISTARRIAQHKKEMAQQFDSRNSSRHNDHERRFNLYMKLFIVMGINWSMEILLWLLEFAPEYVWYITDLANALQGVIIFITFVWQNRIKRLLLKRFGFNARTRTHSRNSRESAGSYFTA